MYFFQLFLNSVYAGVCRSFFGLCLFLCIAYNYLLPGKLMVVYTREKSTKKRKRKKSMKKLKGKVKVQDMSLKSKYRSHCITKPR